LYDSAANANGCLAIFHPSYIDACLKTGDMRLVCVADFLLPPAQMCQGTLYYSLTKKITTPVFYFIFLGFFVITTK